MSFPSITGNRIVWESTRTSGTARLVRVEIWSCACTTALNIVVPGAAETRISLKNTRVSASDDLLAAVDRLFGAKVAQVR